MGQQMVKKGSFGQAALRCGKLAAGEGVGLGAGVGVGVGVGMAAPVEDGLGRIRIALGLAQPG